MKKKLILFTMACLFYGYSAQAQVDSTWNKIMGDMEKQFTDYQKNVQNQFDKFVEQNDKKFSTFLEKSWKEVEMTEGIMKKAEPKPNEKPVIKKEEIIEEKTTPVAIIPIKEEEVVEQPNNEPITPGIQKSEKPNYVKSSHTFSFYGTDVYVSFDEALKIPFSGQILPADIAAYWEKMSQTEHYATVNDLLDLQKYMQLPDWGYLELVQKFSAALFPADKNSANMLTWFLMNKSRYKVRLAYSAQQVYLLIPSLDVIYRTRYYTFDNVRYYLFDNNAPKVYTYEQDYPDAKIYMSLALDKPILLHNNLLHKSYSFEYEQKKYSYSVDINKNLIDFYADYPSTEVDVNFNAPLSQPLYESFLQNISPLIAGRSKIDAANLLLALVQKSFQYQTDQEQFGYEKYFYTEELFYYPASDCEDRSVLYAKLATTLLNVETIGLKYPGHMATAIDLPELTRGDYVMSAEKKYYVADATFENAPVGICMSQFRAVNPKVVQTHVLRSFSNTNFIDNFKKTNPNIFLLPEGIQYSANGNKLMTGTFAGDLNIKGKKFNAQGINSFFGEFSNKGDLVWLKVAKSNVPNYPKQVAINNGKIYINGVFSDELNFDGKTLSSTRPEHYVACLDEASGKILWLTSLDLINAKRQGDFIYAARLNSDGQLGATMYYDRKDYFDNFGFKIEADGSVAVSNSFFGMPVSTEYAQKTNQSFADVYAIAEQKSKEKSSNKNFIEFASVFKALRLYNMSVTGKEMLNQIHKIESNFSSDFPIFSKDIAQWGNVDKEADVFNVKRNFSDCQIENLIFTGNLSFTVGEYSSGNVYIEPRAGIVYQLNGVKYVVNSILFNAQSGKVLVDYSINHYQKVIDLSNF